MRINRKRYDENRVLQRVEDRAVERSRVPGTPSLGTSSGAGSVISAGLVGNATLPDEDGNTIYTAMTEIDSTENPFARTVPSKPTADMPITRNMPEGFGDTD